MAADVDCKMFAWGLHPKSIRQTCTVAHWGFESPTFSYELRFFFYCTTLNYELCFVNVEDAFCPALPHSSVHNRDTDLRSQGSMEATLAETDSKSGFPIRSSICGDV